MQLGLDFKFVDEFSRVVAEEIKARKRSLFRAAAVVRKTAVSLVTSAPPGVPSRPGTPVHTHRGAFFRRAIRFAVESDTTAVIGPRHSIVGDVGAVHEHGESRDGVTYPRRPTMEPALQQSITLIGDQWEGSIGR